MRCPYCGYRESKVVDSRPADEGASIRRRRECLSCEKRFTTYETIEYLPMVVIKKDGSRQSFDRSKVLRALYVGDSEVDVDTARNAGLAMIGVSWGFRGRAALESAGAPAVADTPAQLLELLR